MNILVFSKLDYFCRVIARNAFSIFASFALTFEGQKCNVAIEGHVGLYLKYI